MDTPTIAPATDRRPPTRRIYSPASDIVHACDLPLVAGISTTTAWRLRREGHFPAPIRLSVGRIGWRRVDLERWVRERAEASVTPAQNGRQTPDGGR